MKVSEGVYRQRWNHELYQVYKDPDINSVVKHLRLSWAGHVAIRDKNLPVQRALHGDFNDGKRTRGRPKTSWEDAVDKDSAKFGLPNWQREALDRPKYRKFFDAVKARTRAERPAK
jgi:hypothetical protein